MAETLKSLISKRGAMKSKLTRLDAAFANLKNDTNNLDNLALRVAAIEPIYREFEDIQSQIELIDPSEKQIDERTSFEDSYFEIISKIKTFIEHSRSRIENPAARELNSCEKSNVKIPQLTLPTFEGRYDQFPTFMETFNALIDGGDFSDIEKFQYLKGCLKNEAKALIETLHTTAENYKIALELLSNRYTNKRLLIKSQMHDLFNLNMVIKDSPSSLRELIDKISKILKVLKTLGLPTEHWDAIIIHLATTKLDFISFKEWENCVSTEIPTFSEFSNFINKRSQLLESFKFKQPSHSSQSQIKHNESKPQLSQPKKLSFNFQITKNSCGICLKSHDIFKCEEFLKLSTNERYEKIKILKRCINCLSLNHGIKTCKAGNCKKCDKKHNTLLHFESNETNEVLQEQPDIASSSYSVNHSSNSQSDITLLSTALVHVQNNRNQFFKIRALLDVGSQSNFITTSVAKLLRLPIKTTNISIMGINGKVSQMSKTTRLTFKSIYSDYVQTIECVVLDKIATNLPQKTININSIKLPCNVQLADPQFHICGPIELLLGASVFWNVLIRNQESIYPYLHDTHLGMVVGGTIPTNQNKQYVSLHTSLHTLTNQLAKFFELEEVPTHSHFSKTELMCESHFKNTYTIDTDGHFIVSLPFKEDHKMQLGNSLINAKLQFQKLEQRLQQNPQLKSDYTKFIHEYLHLGHASVLGDINQHEVTNDQYFLPHHPVIKLDSATTKLRVVFNGSAKSTNGRSLNDLLLVGPTIQPDLISILINFRIYNYVFISDISKMYRQIRVFSEDRKFQQILWRDEPSDPLLILQLNTVTYGTSSAPFLAIRSLVEAAILEKNSAPLAYQSILNDFYVDNLLTGANSIDDCRILIDQIIQVLNKYGFPLSQWASNNELLLPDSEKSRIENIPVDRSNITKTLGLQWNLQKDSFQYSVNNITHNKPITKRNILSILAQIFDPIGLITPLCIQSKMLIQSLWSQKLGWDESLPSDLCNTWRKFLNQLSQIKDLSIPRQITSRDPNCTYELHGFSDASMKAYGAAIYLRSTSGDQYLVNLLCSKSRVAPLKPTTLPRLELCAALLLSKLVQSVMKFIKLSISKIYLWTDSTIVLSWLAGEPSSWKLFVANRVSEIQTLTNNFQWHHVPTELNPADIITRGTTIDKLINNNLWWHGPQFLLETNEYWPNLNSISENNQSLNNSEIKCSFTTCISQEILPIFTNYSSYQKLQRIIAYCKRFIYNTKHSKNQLKDQLTNDELNLASITIIKVLQQNLFAKDLANLHQFGSVGKQSTIKSLNPFLDDNQLIRVGGRLANSTLEFDRKHPILLPNHHVTKLIIWQEHVRLLHAGIETTLNTIRQFYWPICGKNLVKGVLRKCLKCFKIHPKLAAQQMGNLPKIRVLSDIRPFHFTGVDYAGPFHVTEIRARGKKSFKAYIVLFICMTVKAVHIEIVFDLTTDSFLAALKRFISRRGLIHTLYSDNATTFVGARNELKELNNLIKSESFKIEVYDYLQKNKIIWKFIPPRSPHHGGLWEGNIKCVKTHIKKVIGNSILNHDEMFTLLVRIEAALNSRPITQMSTDPNDLSCLTPGHFLIGGPLMSYCEPDLTQTRKSYLSRWQLVEQFNNQIWHRWRRDYLHQLQQRKKWQFKETPIQIGQLAIIHQDAVPPLMWRLGRIVKLHPSNDGLVRVVDLKTENGTITRSIVKISILPVDV